LSHRRRSRHSRRRSRHSSSSSSVVSSADKISAAGTAALLEQIKQRLSKEQAVAIFRGALGKTANAKMSVSGELSYKKYCVASRQVVIVVELLV